MDFIRRRILDLDSHIHLLSPRIYELIPQVDCFWHIFRASADTEAALFTNIVEEELSEMQPPSKAGVPGYSRCATMGLTSLVCRVFKILL